MPRLKRVMNKKEKWYTALGLFGTLVMGAFVLMVWGIIALAVLIIVTGG